MKNIIISLSIVSMLITSSCSKSDIADLVIINGKVFTIDREHPSAEAVAIKGDNNNCCWIDSKYFKTHQ